MGVVLPRGEAAGAKGMWGAPWLSESELLSGFWGAIPILVFLRCLGAAGCKIAKFDVDAAHTRPECVRMWSRSISAFQRVFYHLPTRPEC